MRIRCGRLCVKADRSTAGAVSYTHLLGMGMLAGCGSKDSGASTPAGETGGAAATEGAAAESAADSSTTDKASGDIPTLIWWTVGGTTPSDYNDRLADINEYLVEKLGVKIDVKVAGCGDYDPVSYTHLSMRS